MGFAEMFIKYVLPVVAVMGIIVGVYGVSQWKLAVSAGKIGIEKKVETISEPDPPPPRQPSELAGTIYGAGLVEAQRENIPIGTPVPGVVMEVYVDGRPGYDPPHKKVGDRVKKGEPLFRIDDRDLLAELKVRKAIAGGRGGAASAAGEHAARRGPSPRDRGRRGSPCALDGRPGNLQPRLAPLPEEDDRRQRLR